MTEHRRAVHRYAIPTRPVLGVGEGTGGTGGYAVVGAGVNKSGGGKGSGGVGSRGGI